MQKPNIIIQIIKRPSSAFREISENPGRYFASAVAIFILAICLSLPLSDINIAKGILGIADESYTALLATELIQDVILLPLVFGVIFYLGRRFGAISDFKKLFTILSFCLIPMIIANVSILLGIWIGESVLTDDTMVGDELLPSHALDFAGSNSFRHLILGHVGLVFFAWLVILVTLAVKTVNNFGIRRSLGIVILSGIVWYLFEVLYDLFFVILLDPYTKWGLQ